jgi:hypothetical protein
MLAYEMNSGKKHEKLASGAVSHNKEPEPEPFFSAPICLSRRRALHYA